MARRKRAFLDDDSSSNDSEDNEIEEFELGDKDVEAERLLHEDPYQQRKRRRLNGRGKDDATYGVFGEDDDDGPLYRRSAPKRKAKTPIFQRSSTQSKTRQEGDEQDDEAIGEGTSSSADSSSAEDASLDSEEEAQPRSRHKEEYMDELEEQLAEAEAMEEEREEQEHEVPTRRGGIGNRSGIGSSGGIGSGAAGRKQGMSFALAKASTNEGENSVEPSSFAESSKGLSSGRRGIGARPPAFTLSGGKEQVLDTSLSRDQTIPVEDKPILEASNAPSPQVPPSSASGTPTPGELPPSFSARTQRAFVRSNQPAEKPVAPVQLSSEERAHFAKISGGFGAKMMAKMGWEAGRGLGTEGQGIVTPVETKLRPKANMGIAFGGFKERTKQAITEDKRRGKKVSDDEDDKPRHKGKDHGRLHAKEDDRSDAWRKKSKSKKITVEHKTYEEIVQEAGLDTSAVHQAGIGPIIDATGATLREVSSLAGLSSWTPSTDTMRIPEIRHNLRLMVDMSKQDLQGLAQEGKSLEEKRVKSARDEMRLSKKVQEEADMIRRLGDVKIVVDELAGAAKAAHEVAQTRSSMDYEASTSSLSTLDTISPFVERLIGEFSKEYETYRIDEALVGAISPILRLELAEWQPLENPRRWTSLLIKWRSALKMSVRENEETALSTFYGTSISVKLPTDTLETMTPWEAFLWHAWLPRIRSAINNDWDASDAAPAVTLYEVWYDLVPPFIQDNILDQLVLPKVHRTIAAWKPGSSSLQSIVFPWLPHVGLRMDELLGDTRRKVRSAFRAVDISRGVPEELMAWKQIFDQGQWDDLVLKYIIPKLGATLRDDFRINPRKQNMDPLNWVMEWFIKKAVRGSIMSQLFEKEFFPKWLEALYIWLTQPKPGYEEIAQWYSFWQTEIPDSVLELEGVRQGFNRGLEFIDEAITLGDAERMKLPKPTFSTRAAVSNAPTRVQRPRTQESTRDMAEAFAATHDVLFLPAGMVHLTSRLPMYRITGRKDGRGGVLVYFQDDVVWAVEGGTETGAVRAVSFDEMVILASKGR